MTSAEEVQHISSVGHPRSLLFQFTLTRYDNMPRTGMLWTQLIVILRETRPNMLHVVALTVR